jgi:hypothetical protein
MAETSRDSYSGPTSALADVLARFDGPSLCRYGDESPQTTKAKLLVKGPKGIEGSIKLLELLHDIQPNLSFCKNQTKAALHLVYENQLAAERSAKTGGWASRMTATDLDDWVETLQRRIRNLCRVTSQAVIKNNASWLSMLPWHQLADGASDEEGEEEDPPEDDEAVDAEEEANSKSEGGDVDSDEAALVLAKKAVAKKPAAAVREVHGGSAKVVYGFSKELMLPWREVPGGDREVGLPCKIPKKINCTDKVSAEWPDGSIAKLPISYGELQALDVERKHGGPQPGNLLELEVAATKHKLSILQKVDRHLLLIITEQARQICMVKVSLFGEVKDETARLKNDDPVLKRALDFMSMLAKEYAAGNVRRTELADKRNEMLTKMGITGKKRKMVEKAGKDEINSKPVAKAKAKCTAAKMAAAAAARSSGSSGSASSSQQAPQTSRSAPSQVQPSTARVATPRKASTTMVSEPPMMDSYDVVMKFFET